MTTRDQAEAIATERLQIIAPLVDEATAAAQRRPDPIPSAAAGRNSAANAAHARPNQAQSADRASRRAGGPRRRHQRVQLGQREFFIRQ